MKLCREVMSFPRRREENARACQVRDLHLVPPPPTNIFKLSVLLPPVLLFVCFNSQQCKCHC